MIGTLARHNHGVPRSVLQLLQPRCERVGVAHNLFADANVELMVVTGMFDPVGTRLEGTRALPRVKVAICAVTKQLTAHKGCGRLARRGKVCGVSFNRASRAPMAHKGYAAHLVHIVLVY